MVKKAVCRLVWDMNQAECDAYLENALSGIPEHFSGKLLEVPVGTGILTMPLYRTLPEADITCLDNTGRACDNGRCKIYNLDFPDVITVRRELLPAGEREQNFPCNLNDTAWFSEIDASGGAVFFASGVFYYFLTEQVQELVRGWRMLSSAGCWCLMPPIEWR